MKEIKQNEIEVRMAERKEKTVLHLSKHLGRTTLRYILAERMNDGSPIYSIYAEFKDEKMHTVESIPDFSPLKETAEAFCRLIARTLATPLSLSDIYEDTLTP